MSLKAIDTGFLRNLITYDGSGNITLPALLYVSINKEVATKEYVDAQNSGQILQSRTLTINGVTFDLSANRSWTINSMVYPSAGIALSSETGWGTSIVNNSANWNTAFGWGNHASAGYVPYTGATTDVDLGIRSLTNFSLTSKYVKITSNTSTYLSLWSTAVNGNHWALNSSDNGNFYIAISGATINAISINPSNKVDFGSTIGNGTHTYTLPGATGTLALTSDLGAYVTLATTQTITAQKSFSNLLIGEKGIILGTGSTTFAAGSTTLNGNANGLTIGLGVTVSGTTTNYAHQLLFPQITPYTYTYPASSGTIALTSNLAVFELLSNKSNNASLGSSDVLYPTQAAVKSYVDSAVTGGVNIQGDWNANTNSPNISGTTTTGFTWRVSVAGSTNLGGITVWNVNDLAVKTASGWIKIDNSSSVVSVYGRQGIVVANAGDYNTSQVTESVGSLYFTTARARASFSAGTNVSIDGNGVISSANTIYNNFTRTVAGLVPNPGGATTTRYLREDGTWVIPPDTIVTSLAWTSITSRPTALSQFTNDLGNYGSFLTAYTDTLATVTSRGASTAQNITFTNGRKGLIGVYDAAQTQAIFSMGAAYTLTDGGASNNIGNLYGLAWSYNPDYAAAGNNPQSKAGLNHQLLLMQNGVTTAAMGSGIWTSGNISAANYSGTHSGTSSGTNTGDQTNISGKADGANKLWAVTHPTDYYMTHSWTGSHWYLTVNHPSAVRVGYADYAAGAASAETATYGRYAYDAGLNGGSIGYKEPSMLHVKYASDAKRAEFTDTAFFLRNYTATNARFTEMTFYWVGQSGQPTWLFGSNNGSDVYVWNPANFSVNYATTAGSATDATKLPLAGGTLTGDLGINGSTNIPLSINGTEPYMHIVANGASNTAGLRIYPTNGYTALIGNFRASGELVLVASNTEAVFINSNSIRVNKYRFNGNGTLSGNGLVEIVDMAEVGMATQANSYRWYSANAASILMSLNTSGHLTANAFFEASDIRYKDIIETNPEITGLGIDVIKFTRHGSDMVRYGYSAQQVQAIIPESVHGEETLTVNYMDIHTLKIASLERRVKELEDRLKNTL